MFVSINRESEQGHDASHHPWRAPRTGAASVWRTTAIARRASSVACA